MIVTDSQQAIFRLRYRFVRHDGKTFAALIETRLKELDKKAFQVESTSPDLKEGAIRNVLRAAQRDGPPPAGPTLAQAQAICASLGLELFIGLPREPENVQPVDLEHDDFAPIELHEGAALAAGGGAQNGDFLEVSKLAFRVGWLKKIGVRPGNAKLVRVRGDSMVPGLQDGDMAMIDTARTEVKSGELYAFLRGDLAYVKRLDIIPKVALLIRSDNATAYPMETLVGAEMNQVKILGQVVWSGHTWV